MGRKLFNTLHPMLGKGIFLPLGEWDYDGRVRQRLDRVHAEAIANELNGRIARGEPGIPVYQGHPDVPELAAHYPDKGALGWVTHIDLVNECCQCGNVAKSNSQLGTGNTGNIGNTKPGLALAVEWDRDPGRGFRWFSPYWVANERAGDTWIVSAIASVGLVNNPNIPEFRLANEAKESFSTHDLQDSQDSIGPDNPANPVHDVSPNEKGTGEEATKDTKGTKGEEEGPRRDLERTPTKEPNMDNELKTKLLAALGLPTDSDDEAILAAVRAAAKAVGELAGARAKAEAAEAEKTAAEKEKDETKAALANERAARISLLLDGAISEARITPAEKPRWEKLLGSDFETNRIALANEAPKLKTSPAASAPAALAVANSAANIDLVALANEKMRANPRLTYSAAFAQVMAEHPEIK